MYSVNPPDYPETLTDEDFKYTSIQVPGFVGLQVVNGPYGAKSSEHPSDGTVHFCCDKEMQTEEFLEIADWVKNRGDEILDAALASFVEQYWEMRDLVLECLEDEEPDDVVPEISDYKDLVILCGIVGVHVKPYLADKVPRFGLEFGCNWEDEHGAGARFEGVRVVESGQASVAFDF
jgi:Domain of unknown function (DUF6985)